VKAFKGQPYKNVEGGDTGLLRGGWEMFWGVLISNCNKEEGVSQTIGTSQKKNLCRNRLLTLRGN